MWLKDKLLKLVERLENIADHLETSKSIIKSEFLIEEKMSSIDNIITGPLETFLNLSEKVHVDVKNQALLLSEAFAAEKVLVLNACGRSRPSDSQMTEIFTPLSSEIQKVIDFKDANRKSQYFDHLSAVAESIAALGWIGVSESPSKHIQEMLESAKFYSNRILRDYKDKDPIHVEWVHSLFDVWSGLKEYVDGNHRNGLVWGSGDTSSTAPSAPPPPPPPPPPSNTDSVEATSALFAELNRGEAVTAGLRRVTDDMKTHKNPALKTAVATGKTVPPIPVRPDQRTKVSQKQTPSCMELRGNKWCVESFTDNANLVVNVEQIKETVYIFKCNNCVVQVKGKANSIVLDSCKKTSILFENVISSVDIVNCQSAKIQVTGLVPTVNIDKTDGCHIYLSETSKEAEIITAKSSEMNILIPQDNGEYVEYPIPEQFKTKFTGSGLHTKCNDLS